MIGVLIYIGVVLFVLRLVRMLHERDQHLLATRTERAPQTDRTV